MKISIIASMLVALAVGFGVGIVTMAPESTCPVKVGDPVYGEAPILFDTVEFNGHVSAVRGTDTNCEIQIRTEEFGSTGVWGHHAIVQYGVRP